MKSPLRSAVLAGVTAMLLAVAFTSSAQKVGDRLPQKKDAQKKDARGGYREIAWEDLVPKDWDPAKFFRGMDLSSFNDSDPRAIEALEKLREVWDNAPAVKELEGARVRIPGFVVPLDSQAGGIREFLLVPYFGACIHTPPPPSNQIIHVFPPKPLRNTRTMDAVWINGVLGVARTETGMGNAGYRLRADSITPYRK